MRSLISFFFAESFRKFNKNSFQSLDICYIIQNVNNYLYYNIKEGLEWLLTQLQQFRRSGKWRIGGRELSVLILRRMY